MRWSRQAKTEDAKNTLIDLALTWRQAALMRSESEHPLVWNLRQIGGDYLYKIAHSWLDPVVNPVQTALGCPLRTEALAYPINGAER